MKVYVAPLQGLITAKIKGAIDGVLSVVKKRLSRGNQKEEEYEAGW